MFLVKDGQLLTSALGTVLRSITRMSVLEAAKMEGIKTVEGRLPSEMIFEADELFFSCSPMKVLPVRQIDDYVLDDAPGPVTRKMVALLAVMPTVGMWPRRIMSGSIRSTSLSPAPKIFRTRVMMTGRAAPWLATISGATWRFHISSISAGTPGRAVMAVMASR